MKTFAARITMGLFVLSMQIAQWEPSALAATVYVSPQGSDTAGNGSISNPYKTISKACLTMTFGDTCLIRGGTYREQVVPPSGTTFMPYGSETVTISGAEIVQSSWAIHSGVIYVATNLTSSNPSITDMGRGKRQVFFDGQAMTEACWPNPSGDPSRPQFSRVLGGNLSGSQITIVDLKLPPNPNWTGADLVASLGPNWVFVSGTISGVQYGNTITAVIDHLVTPDQDTPQSSNPYYVVGTLSLLDAPTEWYIDPTGTQKLYLQTPSGDSPAGHVVEVKSRLNAFDLSGKSNVRIYGINIFAATINTSDSTVGCILDRLSLKYVSHSRVVLTCPWIDGSQDTGVVLKGANNVIKSSNIAFSSGSGIVLLGSQNEAYANTVHDTGYSGTDTAGISTGGLGSTTGSPCGDFAAGSQPYYARSIRPKATFNTVFNTGGSGILHRNDEGGDFSHNEVYNAGLLKRDNGLIYSFGNDGRDYSAGKNSVISYNYLHDNLSAAYGAGVYLDNESRNYDVHHNVIWNADYGVALNSPSFSINVVNNTILGNIVWNDSMNNSVQIVNNIHSGFQNGYIPPGGAPQSNLITEDTWYYVDPTNGSFALNPPPSPSVDAGVALSPFTDGFVAVAPDIGAYEYGLVPWASGVSAGGLIGHWKLDQPGGSSVPDASGHNNDGNVSGNPTWVTGKVGNAISLNGTSTNYVTIPDKSELRLTGDMTIAFWMKRTSQPTNFQRLVGKGNVTLRNYGVWFDPNGGNRILFEQYDQAGQSILHFNGSTRMSTNQWYHVACVINNGTGYIYINGVKETSQSRFGTQVPATSSDTLTLGYSGFNAAFKGILDDVRIYDRALNSDEIVDLAGQSLVGYWKLDESSGISVSDSSGFNNSGSIVGSSTPAWQSGKAGGGLLFNSPGVYANVPDKPELRITNDLTIAFWMKKTSQTANFQRLVGKGIISGSPQLRNYGVWDISTGHILFQQFSQTGASVLGLQSTSAIPVGQWYHVACVIDQNVATIYINGLPDGTATRSNLPTTSTAPVTIGSDGSGTYPKFSGLLDEVRIYNRALKPGEIQQLITGIPIIGIYNPIANATFSLGDTVTVQALANDSDGFIRKVDCYINSVLYATDLTRPYSFSWQPTLAGTYTIKLAATDDSGILCSTQTTLTISSALPPATAIPNLIANWKFDESPGSQAFDVSGYGNTGNLLGSPVPQRSNNELGGVLGGTLEFGLTLGNVDYVSVNTPSNPRLKLPGDMTLSFRMKAAGQFTGDGAPEWQRIVGKGDGVKRNFGLWHYYGNLMFQQYDSDGIGVAALVAPVAPDVWHSNVTAVVKDNNFYIFVDGVKYGPGVRTGIPATSDDPVTMAWASYNSRFRGVLDDVRIYDRALTDDEVEDLRDLSLVGHWRFDEATGTYASDSSSYGANGQLLGGPLWTTPGMIKNCLTFNGPNAAVSIADATRLRLSGDLTIAFWMKRPSSTLDVQRIVGKGDVTQRNYGVWFDHIDGDKILFQQYDSSGQSIPILQFLNTTAMATGQWYHVACVINNNIGYIYLNGTLETSQNRFGTQIPATSSDPVILGYPGYNSAYAGLLDDVRIYNRALTVNEILKLASHQ